jgi:hypothetical protein
MEPMQRCFLPRRHGSTERRPSNCRLPKPLFLAPGQCGIYNDECARIKVRHQLIEPIRQCRGLGFNLRYICSRRALIFVHPNLIDAKPPIFPEENRGMTSAIGQAEYASRCGREYSRILAEQQAHPRRQAPTYINRSLDMDGDIHGIRARLHRCLKKQSRLRDSPSETLGGLQSCLATRTSRHRQNFLQNRN